MIAHLCLSLGFLFFGGSGPKKTKPEVELVRVWPMWRNTDSFKRISEYFTGRENSGGLCYRRSQPAHRDGYYLLVRVRHRAVSLEGAKFVVRVIMPDSPDPRPPFVFPADVPAGEQVFEIGLTGSDWPGAKIHPVAWRLDLLAPDGHALAWAQSFLWSKPGVVPLGK